METPDKPVADQEEKHEGTFGLLEGPVHLSPEDKNRRLVEGMALCLSGGGYRAMLFHTGVLWRLNEIGFLYKLRRISSVSGGSISAGVLASKWSALEFKDSVASNFEEEVVRPVRGLADRTIDIPAVLRGLFGPRSIGDHIAGAYGKYLFGNKTLQDISSQAPLFVFNATNVQSGVLWRFTKAYMRDYRVGQVKNPDVELAIAVAASSAFPPFLSPTILRLTPSQFEPDSGADLQGDKYRTNVVLSDGGVYDNLGLEMVWKLYRTVLVSDAGGGFEPEEKPERDWLRHSYRTLETIDNQVRSLRKRQVVDSFKAKVRKGTYWSIRTDAEKNYAVPSGLPCPFERTSKLAAVPTRLGRLDRTIQERLINWGYALSDRAIRKFVDKSVPAAHKFPFESSAV